MLQIQRIIINYWFCKTDLHVKRVHQVWFMSVRQLMKKKKKIHKIQKHVMKGKYDSWANEINR